MIKTDTQIYTRTLLNYQELRMILKTLFFQIITHYVYVEIYINIYE